MMPLENIRGRIRTAIAAGVISICFLVSGAALAFWLSPVKALEWRRIEGLPELDAATYSAVATDDKAVVTGMLVDNPEHTQDGLVAYVEERWDVRMPSSTSEDSDREPSGSWTTVDTIIPALTISISGGNINTVGGDSANLGGSMHQSTVKRGTSSEQADFDGQPLPDGSTRMRGFANGDLVTVVGNKASTGGLIPTRLFGGDRVQLVQDMQGSAQSAFMIGVAMMVCSPLIVVLGVLRVLGGLLGRRRKSRMLM